MTTKGSGGREAGDKGAYSFEDAVFESVNTFDLQDGSLGGDMTEGLIPADDAASARGPVRDDRVVDDRTDREADDVDDDDGVGYAPDAGVDDDGGGFLEQFLPGGDFDLISLVTDSEMALLTAFAPVSLQVGGKVASSVRWSRDAAERLEHISEERFAERDLAGTAEALAVESDRIAEWRLSESLSDEEKADLAELEAFAIETERNVIMETLFWDSVAGALPSGNVLSDEKRRELTERLSDLDQRFDALLSEGFGGSDQSTVRFADPVLAYSDDWDEGKGGRFGFMPRGEGYGDYLEAKGYLPLGVVVCRNGSDSVDSWLAAADDGAGGVIYGLSVFREADYWEAIRRLVAGYEDRGETFQSLGQKGAARVPDVVFKEIDSKFCLEWVPVSYVMNVGPQTWAAQRYEGDDQRLFREACAVSLADLLNLDVNRTLAELRQDAGAFVCGFKSVAVGGG